MEDPVFQQYFFQPLLGDQGWFGGGGRRHFSGPFRLAGKAVVGKAQLPRTWGCGNGVTGMPNTGGGGGSGGQGANPGGSGVVVVRYIDNY